MKLNFNKNTTIAEIQSAFSKLFPFLKIEFFTRQHEPGSVLWSKYMVFDHHKTLGEIVDMKEENHTVDINPSMSVRTFEQILQDKLGLSAQIFRKSMGTWIATTESDSWSFELQNSKGEEASTNIPEMIYIARDNQED